MPSPKKCSSCDESRDTRASEITLFTKETTLPIPLVWVFVH